MKHINMQQKEHASDQPETETKRVSKKTLNSLELYNDAIVRPMKKPNNIKIDHGYFGEIIKLPSGGASYRYDAGEEWKKVLKKEREFNVGDRVMYSCKLNIMMDGEQLHLVGYFFGKLREDISNCNAK
jgi:hypothetical protein